MKIIIVGGDKVSHFLIRALADRPHSVTVVENRLEACERLNAQFEIPVFHGDGTHLEVLEQAGAKQADMLIALTGRDENNLIACELAKKSLGIRTTVSKVNNPRNTEIFKRKGVDKYFSSTQLLVDIIEQEVDYAGMHTAFSVPGNMMIIVEFYLSEHSDAVGQTLQSYRFPRGSKLVLLTRTNGSVEMPRGDLEMHAGDRILLICKEKDKESVWKRMVHPEVEA